MTATCCRRAGATTNLRHRSRQGVCLLVVLTVGLLHLVPRPTPTGSGARVEVRASTTDTVVPSRSPTVACDPYGLALAQWQQSQRNRRRVLSWTFHPQKRARRRSAPPHNHSPPLSRLLLLPTTCPSVKEPIQSRRISGPAVT
jgi:hypothetical protein